ncbi:MAG: hypothetical protein ACR2PK_10660 [Acidimicrobiales bacterium]
MSPDPQLRDRHAADVRRAYVAAQRARLYSALTAYVGGVLVVSVIGAMIIGWLGLDDGVIALAFTILVVFVPAAKFYSDSLRTYLCGAALERELDYGVDLNDEATSRHQGLRTFMLVGGVVAAVAAAGVIGYSVANAGTEKPVNLFSVSDDQDGDGDSDEQEAPEGGGDQEAPGEQPESDGGNQPAEGSGESGENDDD